MFKKIFLFLFLCTLAVFPSVSYSACSVASDSNEGATSMVQMLEDCQTQGIGVEWSQGIDGMKERVQEISLTALQFAWLFAVGAFVFAGIRYTTAYGDSAKLESAKKTAIFSGIGLIVALASYSLVNAVIYFLFNLK